MESGEGIQAGQDQGADEAKGQAQPAAARDALRACAQSGRDASASPSPSEEAHITRGAHDTGQRLSLLSRTLADKRAYIIDDGEASGAAPPMPAGDSDEESSGSEEECGAAQATNQYFRRQRHTVDAQDPKAFVGQVAGLSENSAEVAPLPGKAGWVEKANRSWFVPWKWRWLVLRDKQLRWFEDETETSSLGVLDFELIAAEVVRFSEGSSEPGEHLALAPRARGSRSSCCSGRKNCSGVDFRLLFASNPFGTSFLICPRGSSRAFEMRLPTKAEADEWVDALLLHIQHADRPKVSVSSFSTFEDDWWRISRIPPERFEELADSGDVLLFRSKGNMPRLIRAASGGGRFDHVALILKLAGGKIGLLEATGNEGVGVVLWETFIANQWQKLYPELAVRRCRFPRNPERLARLQSWTATVLGKPYSLTVDKLFRRYSAANGRPKDEDFFCSQLVADGLKVLGVLPRGRSSTQFWPSTFSAKMGPLECLPGCSFDAEDLTIDFSLEDTAQHAKAAATAGTGKQRDATTNWG